MLWKRRSAAGPGYPEWVSYEPGLLPPIEMIRQEAVPVLEEWFRWAEEWSMILRVYAKLRTTSAVLEIGCGVGRIAFALRYLLSSGSYDGFDISREKIAFLRRNFEPAHPHFRFLCADIHNTYYNPAGKVPAHEYRFPYPDAAYDIVFAASVFTHMLPENTGHYIHEAGRVLKPGGRAVFSFFLLDHYRRGQARPSIFAGDHFAFDHSYRDFGDQFAVGRPDNPEMMTAYRQSLVERFAGATGLRLAQPSVPGMWSGSFPGWVSPQDLVVLERPG